MKRSIILQHFLGISVVLTCMTGDLACFAAQSSQGTGETIILIRHGEKPLSGLGQLTCKGLNRSLALPSLLIGRYGKADFLYAPDPAVQLHDGSSGAMYSYVRPLATIEPTAIRLGLPVNTQIGFDQIAALQQALLQPAYSHALIFVAWEHIYLHKFAEQMLQSYGGNVAQLPDWPNSDYETIYVFHITRPDSGGTPHVTLEIQKENLGSGLKESCPEAQ